MPDAPPAIPVITDHDLLRPIGRGSYGEVWLARSVLGELRAVKIVRRDGRHADRPFEREFAGLQKFEPISRSHEGLVHVLHAGRFEGGFYYVMELADDGTKLRLQATPGEQPASTRVPAGGATPSETSRLKVGLDTYTPKTLRSELEQLGQLPVGECVEFAVRLTDALAHLHAHGLVHRDLKPSNIIFVRGQPKLADIGLVASADSSMSCVGTEGYLPPEGPGRPQADLYGLGKVLYEMATGRDRTDFPELPTLLREDPGRGTLEELNEVILKACDPDARHRYQTAAGMRADLELIRAGRSLLQVRRRERRWVTARTLGVTAALVVGLVVLVASWWPIPRAPFAHMPTTLAVDGAEFWRAHFTARQFDISPDAERIVFAGTNQITIWERRTRTTRRLELQGMGDWRLAGVRGALTMPRWAPDSRQFMLQTIRTVSGTPGNPVLAYTLMLVDAGTGEAKQIGTEVPEDERALDLCWRPDGKAVTCVSGPRRLTTLSLAGERVTWSDLDLPGPSHLRLGNYSSDGEWLLVSADDKDPNGRGNRDVWVLPNLSGSGIRLTRSDGMDAYPTWSPDDKEVYFVSGGSDARTDTWGIWKIGVDSTSRSPLGPPTEVFARTGVRFLHPSFGAGGRSLAYAVMEPRTDVWVSGSDALEQGKIAVRGQDPVLSPDGQTIYFVGERPDQHGVFAINSFGAPISLRKITDLTPLEELLPGGGLSVSPDGQSVALLGYDGRRRGVFVVPTRGGEPRLLEELPPKDGSPPIWSPDGNWLAYIVARQLVRTSRDGSVREPLATLHFWHPWSIRWSPNGEHLAGFAQVDDDEGKCWVYAVTVADKTLRRLTSDSELQWKEGLEWHPGGAYVTYMIYGPERFNAQIRRAYLDGRPTELMIQQPGHWDYIGVWTPDGRRFYFNSSELNPDETLIHLYDAQTKQITHDHSGGKLTSLPRWSGDGRTAVWTTGGTLRYFEEITAFAP